MLELHGEKDINVGNAKVNPEVITILGL